MGEQDSSKVQINWMSSKEAASYLGVSLQTLYKFIDDGLLAAFHMGRVIRLRYEDVLEFLEGQRIAKGELNQLLRRRESGDLDATPVAVHTKGRSTNITAAHHRAKSFLQEERDRIARALEEIDRALMEDDFDDEDYSSEGSDA